MSFFFLKGMTNLSLEYLDILIFLYWFQKEDHVKVLI
uniref:Uncharacterized protein n=1 Tax=Anguilla anguilla TaxID=7936 RepID=A0A0E9SV30_ANGAN